MKTEKKKRAMIISGVLLMGSVFLCAASYAQEDDMRQPQMTWDERVAQFDINEDGALDREELQAARDSHRDTRRERRQERFEEFDTDGDGEFSEAERNALREARRDMHQERRAQRMSRFDSNDDGQISEDERQRVRESHRKQGRRREKFASADTDGSGDLSREEKRAFHHARMDRDNDNNPPGRRGGPGTNWKNPRGPKGGPGMGPDRHSGYDDRERRGGGGRR